ncbi:MAG TPA: hypothetical protein VF669_10920 [Tepidisphaeraceae bacterium]|jgi:hypothetical protein
MMHLRKPASVFLALAAASVAPRFSYAQKNWNNAITSGNWGVAGNWLEGALPAPTDNVFISASGATSRTVTLDISPTIRNLNIGNAGSGTHTLLHNANVSLSAEIENIGQGTGARGAYNQSAGLNQAVELNIGDDASSFGTYSLAGSGTLSVTGANGVSIGDAGSGAFTQSGGTHNTGYLALGQSGGSGTYTLSAGQLNVAHEAYIYSGGFVQSGGTHTIDNLFVDVGGYTLSGAASLKVLTDENVGASFRQSGGTHTIGGSCAVADYTLSGGSLATAGDLGVFHFTQTGGSHTVAGHTLVVGHYGISAGAFVTRDLEISSDSTFEQTGGSVSAGNLFIAATGRMTVATGANTTLRLSTLSLDAGAILDLNDNDLIVEHGKYEDIRALVWAGYRDAPDSTVTGIISTSGQSSLGHPILALFDNALLQTDQWPFGSANTVGAAAVLGKYTYIGDADLNGMITADDYGAVDSNLGLAADPAGGMNWLQGDWNFDGQITGDDYLAIDANLGLGEANPLTATSAGALVPEPTFFTVLLLTPLLPRRRRIEIIPGAH